MKLYSEICTEKNFELAQALGWTHFPSDDIQPCTKEWQDEVGQWQSYPRWADDSTQSFQLMIKFDCYPVRTPDAGMVAVATGLETARYAIVKVIDHPSIEAAMRFAIVDAVLLKLRFDALRNNGEAEDLAHALLMSGAAALD